MYTLNQIERETGSVLCRTELWGLEEVSLLSLAVTKFRGELGQSVYFPSKHAHSEIRHMTLKLFDNQDNLVSDSFFFNPCCATEQALSLHASLNCEF